MTVVASLPPKDQLVIAQAYRSGCDVLVTNDLQWMRARHRTTIAALGMEAHTPETLVEALSPWLGLWL
jgi:predicted nucleic acid-binding protein